jgi:hypothetical protein
MVRVVKRLEGRWLRTALGARYIECLDVEECLEGHYEVREGCYSWLDNCLERFEGKEARQEYYARLAQEASRF